MLSSFLGRVSILFVYLLGWSSLSHATSVELASSTANHPPTVVSDFFDQFFSETIPYVPQQTDYAVELGSTWETNNLYWTGGTIGFNSGGCWGLGTPLCQQYFILTGGIAGRDGYTHGLSFAGIRWQYVQLPKTYSPFLSVFAGVMNSNVPESVTQSGLWGLGGGIFLYLHEAADFKVEGRIGQGREAFVQVLVAAQIKLDRWVEYFVVRMKDLGIDTAKTTKDAVVTTVTRPGDAMGTVLEASKAAVKKTGEAIRGTTEALDKAAQEATDALTNDSVETNTSGADSPGPKESQQGAPADSH